MRIASIITLCAAPIAAGAQQNPMADCIPALAEAANMAEITAIFDATANNPAATECMGSRVDQRQGSAQNSLEPNHAETEAAANRAEAEAAMLAEQRLRTGNP